jgi:DNA topoisomerase-1
VAQSLAREYVDAAESAGLRYVTDATPGIRRRRHGRGFTYTDADGNVIREREQLRRFRALVIPPAWTDVWICADPDGHLQVTARDARGRKQYRYHQRFRARQDESKFDRMLALSDVLWKIRERVERDIALPGLARDKIMATVVWLLERTLIRIGTDEYAKENNSFGLTTMRRRHVAVAGAKVDFEFRGKSGIEHSVSIIDRRIAKIVQECQELPGWELFKYIDDDGRKQSVEASDINAYLRDITGREVTAKDFRTWAGTMLAAEALREMGAAPTKKQAEKNVVAAVDRTKAKLGNTRSVCRKYYIHPVLIESYLAGDVMPPVGSKEWKPRGESGGKLRRHEEETLAFLIARVERGTADGGTAAGATAAGETAAGLRPG